MNLTSTYEGRGAKASAQDDLDGKGTVLHAHKTLGMDAGSYTVETNFQGDFGREMEDEASSRSAARPRGTCKPWSPSRSPV